MGLRHRNAILIQQGAVNPQAIASAIAAACEEARTEQAFRGTDSLTSDCAIRLMVHQLAFLCGTRAIDDEPFLYGQLIAECEKGNGT